MKRMILGAALAMTGGAMTGGTAQAQQAETPQAETAQSERLEIPAAAPAAPVDAVPADPAPINPKAIWVASATGGVVDRDTTSSSPYGALAITRYKGPTYLRAAYTLFGGTLQQADAAIPSTYHIGSIGAGGNWHGWVADAYVSYGRQVYGAIQAQGIARQSGVASGADYVAAGLRLGRVFQPWARWYITPTIAGQYVYTRSLHQRFDFSTLSWSDFELRERALTGIASVRVDRALGRRGQHYLGLSYSHYVTDNGMTTWQLAPPPDTSGPQPLRTPDGFDEVALAGMWQIRPRLWLDTQVARTAGAVAGNSTTASVGLRVRF